MSGRLAVVALALALAGCAASDAAPRDAERRGLSYLASLQREDGAIASAHYGVLRPGYSTTACALYAFARAPREERWRHAAVIERGLAFLAAHTDPSGAVGLGGEGLDYPNYTSAFYLLALVALRPDGWRSLADRQVAYLRSAQLAEHRGWTGDDPEYGGFAYGGAPVARPLDAELLGISVTAWAVVALRAAGVPRDDPTLHAARIFVERCQGADGGFHFTPAPAHLRSKAGERDGVAQSYGTATADGLRALRALGGEDERARRALSWLRARSAPPSVPGFAPDAGGGEAGLRVYFAAVLTEALDGEAQEDGALARAARVALLAQQREDGAFVGWAETMKEDDPLVATPLALLALSGAGR